MTTQDIKPGYKQSSLGIIPKEWEMKTIEEVTTSIEYGIGETGLNKGDLRYIRITDIDDDYSLKNDDKKYIMLNEKSKSSILNKGDVLIARIGATFGKCLYFDSDEQSAFAGYLVRPNFKKEVNTKYFSLFAQSGLYWNQTNNLVLGGLQPQFNANVIKKINLPLPPLSEQKNIVEILGKVGAVLERISKMIEKLELRNNGLMQQLLTGKLRLQGFSGEWEFIKFKDIFIPFKEKAGNNNYELLSVTKEGIFSQRDYFNKDISSENLEDYLVVRKGDFAMSGLNFWMGSAHMLYEYESGIISPAYKTFHIKNDKVLMEFMKFFIESSCMRRALVGSSVQGASIVRRNLDSEMLENRQFSIPAIEEQKAIANVLNKVTEQLDLYKQKLEKLKELKKGLMQQLLTGKVRVKEFRN